MLNVVETSTKNILPLPFLFVDIRGILSRGILFYSKSSYFRGDSVRGDYVRDSASSSRFRAI